VGEPLNHRRIVEYHRATMHIDTPEFIFSNARGMMVQPPAFSS
jgi:hypothetical protein